MRNFAILLSITATPALAHHEVVVASSLIPLMSVVAAFAAAVFAAFRQKRKTR